MSCSIKVRCLGHSGLDIDLDGTRVVCDPWLSVRGAHLGAWHQFPDNSMIRPESLTDARHLYISHLHQDHLDPETLRDFPKSARVLIARFPGGVLRSRLAALGFSDICELEPWEPFSLGGDTQVRIAVDPTPYVLDSCLILEHRGKVLINQNDCFLDRSQLERLRALQPDVHFTQFSGASYFPAIYEFSPEQMCSHVEAYRSLLFGRFCEVARQVNAPHVVPSAGPPCFFDERYYALNFGNSIFYDVDDLQEGLRRAAPDLVPRIRRMYPQDTFELSDDAFEHSSRAPYVDKQAYLDAYRARRWPIVESYRASLRAETRPVTSRDLLDYFREFFKYEDLIRDLRLLIKVRVVDGPTLFVDFRSRPFRFLPSSADSPNYTLELESAWMSQVLRRRLSWYDLLMSQQITLRRDPDRYCVPLINHLYYRDTPELLDLVRRQNLGDHFITLRDTVMEYECQQWCPHVGRNLAEGTLVDGILTCAGHGWQFDLRDEGRCIKGGGQSVIVRTKRLLKEVPE